MSCNNPLLSYRDKSGAMRILNRDRWTIAEAEHYFGRENVFLLPCGKCSGCRLQKRKEYAVRCAMEAKSYEKSCFITLTYDDEHCPSKLIKRDLTYFIKKIRNRGFKIRYFGCGEYGSTTFRPHYHIIIFNFIPGDIKLFGSSATGNSIFTSGLIDSLWNKGFATVQLFEPAVASYVAGYVDKKVSKDDGFLIMSKKPGLGYQYMMDHYADFIEFDFVIDDFGNIKKAHAPRYFDKIAERLHLDMTYTKAKRIEAVSLANAGEMFSSGLDREALMKRHKERDDQKINKLRRSL